jgi:hypothetical protein
MAATAKMRLPRDFRFLWASAAVSGLGTRISTLATPTIAVLVLHAGPLAVGAITALGTLPVLLFSMLSGVIADRGNRRRIVVSCDVVSMLATGSVPLAAALGHMTLVQLFVTTLVNGVAGNLGNITFYSIVPVVVPRSEFDRANARLEATNIVNVISGPGLGGLLLPLAAHVPGVAAIAVVVGAYLLRNVENGLWNVSMITLRRAFTPDEMFGRMVASTRTLAQGTQPIGAILGGVLGAAFGVVPVIIIGGVLMAVCGSIALDPELRRISSPGERHLAQA